MRVAGIGEKAEQHDRDRNGAQRSEAGYEQERNPVECRPVEI
jgi:hypothetical protein